MRERGIDYVSYRDWQVLDQYEVAAGRAEGRPRVKVTTVPEMMAIIREGRGPHPGPGKVPETGEL